MSNIREFKQEECPHSVYCGHSKGLCVNTNYKERCLMKDSEISSLPLFKFVKNVEEKRKNSSVQ